MQQQHRDRHVAENRYDAHAHAHQAILFTREAYLGAFLLQRFAFVFVSIPDCHVKPGSNEIVCLCHKLRLFTWICFSIIFTLKKRPTSKGLHRFDSH